jgi:predicted phosphodiesterase
MRRAYGIAGTPEGLVGRLTSRLYWILHFHWTGFKRVEEPMPRGPSIAVTADLHWGHHRRGDEANGLLVDFLRGHAPDLLIIAGDIGSADNFAAGLKQFEGLRATIAMVAGNHDIWVLADDRRGDSLDVFERHLPSHAGAHGFHYLDASPLILPDHDLAIVGSINWYDYSWGIDPLREHFPDDEWRLAAKRFTRGQHNDARFVRWSLDDISFTARCAASLEMDLNDTLAQASRAIVVTHHPPAPELSFPESDGPPSVDRLLWRALMGNRRVEELLQRYAGRIPLVFCGHTHRAREAALAGGRGYNVGGDYHFKRLLWFDSPDAPPEVHEFGNPVR